MIRNLERQVGNITQRFPGANSVSFMFEHMKEVNCRKTVVCEKTDGVRYFLCEVLKKMPNGQIKNMWLIVDRKYEIRQVSLKFDLDSNEIKVMARQ